MSHTPKESDRCEFTYASGRRCRMVRVAPEEPYCYHHWEREQQEDAAAKAAQRIISSKDPLDSEDGIHKALGNVFRLLAQNRISSRNAAVLGYLGQLMLGNCPSIERTMQSYLPMLQFIMKARQQMDRSEAHSDRHERHLFELQSDLLDRILDKKDLIQRMSPKAQQELREALKAAFHKHEKEKVARASNESTT